MIRNDCIETSGAEDRLYRASITWNAWFKAGIRLFLVDCRRLGDLLVMWQRRSAGRQKLENMDARLLKDMGIGRIDADREAAKPFWRD
ncbi:MAG: DUF1127 domain-containing protein [Alphaproteobacteria bacterium]